jgi:hypothetical protein
VDNELFHIASGRGDVCNAIGIRRTHSLIRRARGLETNTLHADTPISRVRCSYLKDRETGILACSPSLHDDHVLSVRG